MKNHFCIFLFPFLFVTFAVLNGLCVAVEKDAAFWQDIDDRVREVEKVIDNKEYENAFHLIDNLVDYMDEHIGEEPEPFFGHAWAILIRSARLIEQHERFWSRWEHLYKKATESDASHSPYRLGLQMDILACRMRVARGGYTNEYPVIEDRKYMSERMLTFWNGVLSHIHEDFDVKWLNPNLHEGWFDPDFIEIVSKYEFTGASVSTGPYHWEPASSITNEAIREVYQRQIDAAMAKKEIAEQHQRAERVRDQQRKVFKQFLVDIYSLRPIATAELEALLVEYEIEEALAEEILAAVREAEINPPAPPDYTAYHRWLAAQEVAVKEAGLTSPWDTPWTCPVFQESGDGSAAITATEKIEIPMSDVWREYESYPLPEPSSRWKTVLLVNGAIICAMLALYFYFRWRKSLAS